MLYQDLRSIQVTVHTKGPLPDDQKIDAAVLKLGAVPGIYDGPLLFIAKILHDLMYQNLGMMVV